MSAEKIKQLEQEIMQLKDTVFLLEQVLIKSSNLSTGDIHMYALISGLNSGTVCEMTEMITEGRLKKTPIDELFATFANTFPDYKHSIIEVTKILMASCYSDKSYYNEILNSQKGQAFINRADKFKD